MLWYVCLRYPADGLIQLIFVGETVAAHLVLSKFNGLTNSYMSPEERAADDPTSQEHAYRVWGSKLQLIGWSLYVMILWLVKASIAVFYSRLTYVPYPFRW